MKNGFTLIELSKVLVIIGLLIGGILVGQTLINSAKMNKQIQQIQQIQIAVRNFKTTYKSLPGDSSVIGTTGNGISGQPSKVCAGNGNGQINNSISAPVSGYPVWLASNPGSCDVSNAEYMRVFEHLGITKMYKWDQYDDGNTLSFQPGISYPKMILDDYKPKSLGNPGGVVIGWEGSGSYIKEGHKIRLGACNGNASGPITGGGPYTSFYCGPSLPDMIALDKKLDDGKPMSGTVVATANYYIYNISGGWNADQTTCCINLATNTYKLAPTATGTSNGGYIGIEINADF